MIPNWKKTFGFLFYKKQFQRFKGKLLIWSNWVVSYFIQWFSKRDQNAAPAKHAEPLLV